MNKRVCGLTWLLGNEQAFIGALVAHAGDFEERIEPASVFAGNGEGGLDDGFRVLAGGAQDALAAVLADADELHRGGADGGEGLVKIGDQGGEKGDAFDLGLQGADDEMMAGGVGLLDRFVELGELRGVRDRAQGTETAATELGAGFAGFAGDFPGADFAVDGAPFFQRICGVGEAQIGEFVVLLGGDDLLVEEVLERGLVGDQAEADDLLEAQGMGVGAGGKEGVGGLEEEGEPREIRGCSEISKLLFACSGSALESSSLRVWL